MNLTILQDAGPYQPAIGLLILRVALGVVLLLNGLRNATPWFDTGGLASTAEEFTAGGLRGGRVSAALAGTAMIGAGLLLVLGLATPLAAMTAAGVMVVAASVHLGHGFFAAQGGYEYALVLVLAAYAVLWAGPGGLSLDHALGLDDLLTWPLLLAASIVVPAVAAVSIGVLRQRPARRPTP